MNGKTETKEKNRCDRTLRAMCSGQFRTETELDDPAFSSEMMGPCFGIDPDDGQIVAPFEGTVLTVFSGGHALVLRRKDGLEVLIHAGIGTWRLKGTGFTPLTMAGQSVRTGQPLLQTDLSGLKQKGYSPVVICVFTSPVDEAKPLPRGQHIRAGDPLFEITPGKPWDEWDCLPSESRF